jgi:hypothetical protein
MTTEQSPAGADLDRLVIGVLGGTGDQGRGLARRLSRARRTPRPGYQGDPARTGS